MVENAQEEPRDEPKSSCCGGGCKSDVALAQLDALSTPVEMYNEQRIKSASARMMNAAIWPNPPEQSTTIDIPEHPLHGQKLPIRPLHDYVLVLMPEAPKEKVTDGGIYLPDKTSLPEEMTLVEVIAVGPGKHERGAVTPIVGIRPGDKACLAAYSMSGHEFERDGRKFKLVPFASFVGVEVA